MDDPLACADLCERSGFPKQAELLRAITGGRHKAYVVVECHRIDEDFFVDEGGGGTPLGIFLDRAEAEHDAERRNIGAFRRLNVLEYGYEFAEGRSRPRAELEPLLRRIFGPGFAIPEVTDPEDASIFPPDATDAQIRDVMGFTELRFFIVSEVVFAG